MNYYPHFLVHGAIGAALAVVFGWLFGVQASLTVVIVWAVLGITPDLPFGAAYYFWFHYGPGRDILGFIPPIGAHVLVVDPIYHEWVLRHFGGWWIRYWWYEISFWLVSGAIVTYRFVM